ncbi:hypothetical protein NQ314_017745, partial [Rhamnusium bicolor]
YRGRAELSTGSHNINDSGKENDDILKKMENSNKTMESKQNKNQNEKKRIENEIIETDQESDEESNAVIVSAAEKKKGKRVRNKVHYCYFCYNKFQNMARHFEKKHAEEINVAKVLAMPKNSKIRKDGFGEIIRAGDFTHNCDVISVKRGELVLVRRPTENEWQHVSYNDYGPCPHCLGFMLKKHLWHHIKTSCTKNENVSSSNNVIAESNAILNEVLGAEFSNAYIKEIVTKLRDDEIGEYCKSDKLILKFGSMQFEKYATTQGELIRQTMRQLSRLILKIQEVSKNKSLTLTDLLIPEKFDMLIDGTKLLCVCHINLIGKRPEFNIPSLALKLGYALKKCAAIQRGVALKTGDLNTDGKLKSFLHLMELEWSTRISSNALSTLYKRKFNATQLLPLTSDLVKLSKYIDTNLLKYKENLSRCNTTANWTDLATLTLTRVILFNKRRSGEASRMTLENYVSRPLWSQQSTDEMKNSLSPFEKKLAEMLSIVEIEGKRGRKVPVILTEETKTSIDLLVKLREVYLPGLEEDECNEAENDEHDEQVKQGAHLLNEDINTENGGMIVDKNIERRNEILQGKKVVAKFVKINGNNPIYFY